MVMEEQRAQGFAGVAAAIAQFVVAGADVRVEMVLVAARRRKRWARLVFAVIISGKTIAFGRRMQVVQVGGDFRGTEALVVGGEIIVHAQQDRAAVAAQDHRAVHLGRRHSGLVAPHRLGGQRRVERPVALHGM
ncbi:hypothetical protein D3C84_641420 [compost metagenome]